MTLSKQSLDALTDLIQNRLATMHIGDRDDLRERLALQQALSELRGDDQSEDGEIKKFGVIPTRGRRRKVSSMIGEQAS